MTAGKTVAIRPHYTPKLLTEAIVKETLEPLVYEGSL